jgi:hypothetical protein
MTLREQIYWNVWANVESNVCANVESNVRVNVWDNIGANVMNNVEDKVGKSMNAFNSKVFVKTSNIIEKSV